MKHTLLLFNICILCNLFGQNTNYKTIYCNSVSGKTTNKGIIFDPITYNLGYGGLSVNPTTDADLPVSTIYYANINLLGLVNNKVTGTIGETTYLGSDASDLYNVSGPYELGGVQIERYNKIWSVRKSEIVSLINDFNDNGKIDITPSINILKWPARGNKNSKNLDEIIWPDRDLAPFFDRDKDGRYDPYKGDYPILDEKCPEKIPGQMIWSIFHGATGNMEVQHLMYAFSSNKDQFLNNTIFSRCKILNLNDVIRELKFGLYVDFDLGCTSDDYFGSSIEKNTFYAYNASEIDQDPCSNNIGKLNLFKTRSPIQSITYLNQKISGTIIYDVGSSSKIFGNPNSTKDFYNYLSSRWMNGARITYGAAGYNSSSTDYTNFMFPSSPNDPDGWSMVTSNFPGKDPRGYMNTELGNMKKYESRTVDIAYTYHLPDTSIDHLQRVDKMMENIDIVQYWYENCFNSQEHDDICSSECVWPGDTDNNGIVNNLDLLNIGAYLTNDGEPRKAVVDYWDGFTAEPWTKTTPQSLNTKYIDCNGSGKITTTDFNAVSNNFYSTNSRYSVWGGYNIKGPQLSFGPLEDSLKGGEEFKIDLLFAEKEIVPLYGMGFTIEYDSSLLTLVESIFEKKWIDKKATPAFVLEKEKGKLHFGIVKTKGVNSEVNNVKLGHLKFKVRSDFKGDYNTLLRYTNYQKIEANGKISHLTSSDVALVVSNPKDEEPDIKGQLVLYPNPTIEFVFIRSDKTFEFAELFDVMGRQYNFIISDNTFRVTNLPTGAYMVRLTDKDEGKVMKKLVVVK